MHGRLKLENLANGKKMSDVLSISEEIFRKKILFHFTFTETEFLIFLFNGRHAWQPNPK